MNLQQRKADSEERGHAIQEKQVKRPAERDQRRGNIDWKTQYRLKNSVT